MNKLTRGDLLSLEKYAEVRPEFRARVMAHKRNRQLPIGPNATLYFEDALTMHYQVQEMLRAERIFEAAGIQEELDAYNPLIPDGSNWKATFMMEYPDEVERREKLAQLLGVEKHIWVQVADFARVTPIADEDLERETADKTSSVHFLRIELTPEMAQAVKQGAPVSMGIDHPAYNYTAEPIPQNIRDSLAGDLG
ncbi:MAG: DUF3501 family protein [Gammaproteobacteria bacterium]|nr:DUF3501 family protein [Gammaproteobacteria bacterium]MCP5318818.1 DUF3501 family protein [Chromatiaceae bacterium]MCP5435660.1 DUF3501 family protein [Chromatiaceae bacterium]HOP15963.1 DUF3501 family protein [Gammaproteobacteria bacterium]